MSWSSLTLRYQSDGKKIAELSWSNGRTQLIFALERIKPELEMIIEDGLSEWIGPAEDRQPRMTPSSSPIFLKRLADYLGRQFNFVIEFKRPESPKGRDRLRWPSHEGLPNRQ